VNEREYYSGKMDNGEPVEHGKSKLELLFEKMQERMRAYVEPLQTYTDLDGTIHRYDRVAGKSAAFINDIIYLMDGPEQREAQVEPRMINERDYIALALRTESTMIPVRRDFYPSVADQQVNRLLHAAIGMVTESGEFIDMLKKHLFYGKPLDLVNLQEEIGDQLWYIAIALDALGTTFEAEMRRNIAKLKARYPDKFTSDKAINRDLDAERAVLEIKPKLLKSGNTLTTEIDDVIHTGKVAHEMAPEGCNDVEPSHLSRLVNDHDKKYRPIHGSDGTDGA
jgi:NTP pyrophosphatase (non-canonical NTP hydrolase)